MMRLLPVLLLAPSLLVAQKGRPSRGARWTEIGTSAQGVTVFVDPRSVSRAGDVVTATTRGVYTKPGKTPKGYITSFRNVGMYDCAKQRFASKENWLYLDEKQGTLFDHSKPKLPGFGVAFRGSPPDVAMQYLCKKQP